MPSSLVDRYEQACSDASVAPNSALISYIANINQDTSTQALPLKNNFIGPRGLPALLVLLSNCCHTLHTVDLSHNNLGNASIRQMTLCFAGGGFAALRRLELRGNLLTYQGGKCLVHWCEGVKVVRQGCSTGDTGLGESVSKSKATSTGTASSNALTSMLCEAAYWYDAADVNIFYIGIQGNAMSPALQKSLEQRISAAVERREMRRLSPSSRQDRRTNDSHCLSGDVSNVVANTSGTSDTEGPFPADAACIDAVAPDDPLGMAGTHPSARSPADSSSSYGDEPPKLEGHRQSSSAPETTPLLHQSSSDGLDAPAPFAASSSHSSSQPCTSCRSSSACALDVMVPSPTEDQPRLEQEVEQYSVFSLAETVSNGPNDLHHSLLVAEPTDEGGDVEEGSGAVPAWLQ
ncbi:hypothetical protein JKF63_05113 [Porcisia hertigi]|uniref:Uncharacterized protein n=1 Tax=Porcisia hertigi TaxID=2761500 RepID=A0A836LCW5_9TRYP|nr:hypothetical protein JKF63_05113 [Porcisia hertigi]